MGLLLYLVGLLALVSGATHIWGQTRRGMSRSPFALAEIAAGVIVVLASAVGLSRWSGAPFVVVFALAIVTISVSERVRGTLAIRRQRLASEAERLESRVRTRVE